MYLLTKIIPNIIWINCFDLKIYKKGNEETGNNADYISGEKIIDGYFYEKIYSAGASCLVKNEKEPLSISHWKSLIINTSVLLRSKKY